MVCRCGVCSKFSWVRHITWALIRLLSAGPPPRCPKVAVVSHDSPRAQTCTIVFPEPSIAPSSFHETTPKRGRKNENSDGAWEKKKREILGPPPFGTPPFGAPTLRGPHPFEPAPFGDQTVTEPHHFACPTLRGPSEWTSPQTDSQNFAFFSLSRSNVRSFFSLGVFSWNFGGVLKRRCQLCTFGLTGMSCETPVAFCKVPRTIQNNFAIDLPP